MSHNCPWYCVIFHLVFIIGLSKIKKETRQNILLICLHRYIITFFSTNYFVLTQDLDIYLQEETVSAGADRVLEVVGNFAKAIANSLDNLNGSKTIQTDNIGNNCSAILLYCYNMTNGNQYLFQIKPTCPLYCKTREHILFDMFYCII